MTVINLANAPTSVNTVEKGLAWLIYAGRECAPTQAYAEAVGVTNFQIDVQESVSPDGKGILVGRFVLETIPPGAYTGKVWNSVKEIPRSAELPSYYLSN